MAITENKAKNKHFQYHPELPIQVSPLFRSPFDLLAILKWFVGSWFPISERLLILIISVITWYYFHPSLEQTQTFELGWIALITLRNLALIVLVAGGLHLYLYVFKRQADNYKYDTKPLINKRSTFTFNNQVKDNIFWTCASGVPIWSAYEVIMMWALANNYLPFIAADTDYFWIALVIFLIPIWETFYFYLIHRLLHWKPLYRLAHSVHHRNTNVGPWSGFSMHPIEHILYMGSVLIHLVVLAHPLIIINHLQYYALSAVTTHSGFEGLFAGKKKIIGLGTFHHQLHHRYFDCNYGGLEIPWDKWLGSFHDGTEESYQQFLASKKKARAG